MEYIVELSEEIYKSNIQHESEDGEFTHTFDESLAESNIRSYFDGWLAEIDLSELEEYRFKMLEEYNIFVTKEMHENENFKDEDVYPGYQESWKRYAEAHETYRFLVNAKQKGSVWNSFPLKPMISAFLWGSEIEI